MILLAFANHTTLNLMLIVPFQKHFGHTLAWYDVTVRAQRLLKFVKVNQVVLTQLSSSIVMPSEIIHILFYQSYSISIEAH